MMNQILQALDQNRFRLMAQPIIGMRGDSYHEVLLRMVGEQGELVAPDNFLPAAHEFGLRFAHRQLGYRQYAGFYER
ncbi:Putative cytochrome C-type biogenesis protein (plasmid) [Klebsiella aerogenes]|nr:Putative cytochrome C-type biogenesis protein [Klebsiella aerogenes]